MSPLDINTLTREELYKKVWETSRLQLQNEFGISNVAINKRCKKLEIPRPPRGYWAKLKAGQNPEKVPLPKLPEPLEFKQAKVAKSIKEVQASDDLHPFAQALQTYLSKSKPESDKRVKTDRNNLPPVQVSKDLVARTVSIFNAVIVELQNHGIKIRKGGGVYSPAYFHRKNMGIHLAIEEVTELLPFASCGRYRDNVQLTGRLKLTLGSGTGSYSRDKSLGSWEDKGQKLIEQHLPDIIKTACEYYVELDRKKEQEAIEVEKQKREWERQRQEQLKRHHQQKLDEIPRKRTEDLIKAAEWWRIYNSTLAFVDACEERWKSEHSGVLNEGQLQWLGWARKEALSLNPFESGYPNPGKDGEFDADSVPLDGPYPEVRNFPTPRTMPDISKTENRESYYRDAYYAEKSKPYPFWLKYQK